MKLAAIMLPAVVALGVFTVAAFRHPDSSLAASPIQEQFRGVYVGESGKAVFEKLGRPWLLNKNEIAAFWSYPSTDGNKWLTVIVEDGHVVATYVRLRKDRGPRLIDENGIVLGDYIDSLSKIDAQEKFALANTVLGYRSGQHMWIYEFSGDRITGIGLTRSYLMELPSAATNEQRDGTSQAQAVYAGRDARQAATFERTYLQERACESTSHWQILSTLHQVVSGRHFDVLHVACPASKFGDLMYFRVGASVSST
ncbi:MAG: hypothetical protein M3007_05265 [Candidatus Eremiobacteraeota bacterium]|nr:hypothetical protein [Candidatus Eremiobacteraeota bacterium]